MISNIGALIETIENDEKLIAYLKQMYKEKTGEDVVIPDLKALAERQLRRQEERDAHPNLKFNSFKDKVIALKLPDINDREARQRIDKLRRLRDTKVLFTKLDISHFKGKDITPELLYNVLDGLKVLRSVEEIDLSHNGMGDNFIDVISDYLMLKGLYRINLSFNNLTKASVKKLVATLKGCKRLEYLDVSYNPFNLNEYSCMHVCNALKDCEKIFHFGINDASRDSGIRFINKHPTLTSVNLEDSRYKKRAWASLSRILSNKKRYHINRLSLKFCKLDFILAVQPLCRALRRNISLVYLNLYNTGLDDIGGAQIISALCNHRFLEELDVGANFLSIHFCKAFGRVLRVNNILRTVNITKNHLISRDDYFFILEGLVNNQSLLSLGDLIDMKIGVKCRECTEKLLSLNQCSEWRTIEKIKSQKANLYMSNVGLEHIQNENKKLEDKMKEEDEKEEEEEKEEEDEIEENIIPGGYSYLGKNVYVENHVYPVTVLRPNKDNPSVKDKIQKFIILPKKNSNHIDELTNKLPEGYINKYYQESLKNKFSYTNDMNTIIGNMNFTKKEDTNNININSITSSKDNNLSSTNFNQLGKYVVPNSITGSHVMKDLKKYEEQMLDGGKGKRRGYSAKPVSKPKKKKGRKRAPPTIVNTIASLAQEIIDNDEDLKEFKSSSPIKDETEQKIENEKSEINTNTNSRYKQFNIGDNEIMNYGKIDLDEIEVDPEQEKNIITKYNLIENNLGTDFQEQVPFYY